MPGDGGAARELGKIVRVCWRLAIGYRLLAAKPAAEIPSLAENQCINLHSKLVIVHDDVLRTGSANLRNRSMGINSEWGAGRGEDRGGHSCLS